VPKDDHLAALRARIDFQQPLTELGAESKR